MSKKPGDTFGFQFTTSSPTTGALANVDSGLPTGIQVHNGVDDGTNPVTVTNISTGLYKATGTILGSYASGDDLQIRINATVGGVVSAGLRDYGALDTKRVSDLNNLGGTAQTGDSFARIGVAGAGLTVLGDARIANLDAAVSTRSTYSGGAVASVTAPVTAGTVTDKTGYSLAAAGLDQIPITDPGGIAGQTTFPKLLVALYRRFFRKTTLTVTQLKHYADDGSTVNTTQAMSDDSTTQTTGTAT